MYYLINRISFLKMWVCGWLRAVQWVLSTCRPFLDSSSDLPYTKGFPQGAEQDQSIYSVSGVCPLLCLKDMISHLQPYILGGHS